jgi:hypothetical protein
MKQHPGVLARVAPEPGHAQRVDGDVGRVMSSRSDQPTTWRLNRSMTTAR